MTIRQTDTGWWVPTSDVHCHATTKEEVGPAMDWLASINDRWGTIIQAGANTGIFPARLAGMFDTVATFEPDLDNNICAAKNLMGIPNINLYRGALGDRDGYGEIIVHEPGNTGAHRVEEILSPGPLDFKIARIDRLPYAPDVIWLDIEGSELDALRGATKTIQVHHPLILVEEKGLGRFYGSEKEDLAEHLMLMGYEWISSHGADNAYRWRGK